MGLDRALVHSTALIAPDAALVSCSVGPYAVLGLDGPDGAAPLQVGAGAVIRSHAVLYRGTCIGARFHIGHAAVVREQVRIGDDVSIGSHTMIEHDVTVGSRVRLHGGCFVPEHSVLEDGAWLGPGVIVTNARHPNRPDTKASLEGVRIESGAVIGAGAVLLPGVVVGHDAVVGAGAVVVRDVAPSETVVGAGARAR